MSDPFALPDRQPDFTDIIRGLAPLSPPHPDAELLDACARAFEYDRAIERIRETMARCSDREYARQRRLLDAMHGHQRVVAGEIRKTPATTPAGLYAKALFLERTQAPSSRLSKSFAREFRECPGLRALLWPATKEGS